jgi:hypothetical protein
MNVLVTCYDAMSPTAPLRSPATRDLLQWVTQSLRDLYGPRLKHLFLYGSHARGEARPDSDVDLLVVLDGTVGTLEEARRTSGLILRAAAYRDAALSLVHLSEEEFGDDRRPLVRSVKEEGIDLLDELSLDRAAEQADVHEPEDRVR